jgi:dynein heavy chain, axonemal
MRVQDNGGLYDKDKLRWKGVEDTTIVAACGPPGGARQPMSQRFSRHFLAVYMLEPSEATLRHIFEQAASSFFAINFPADVAAPVLKAMVASSVEAHVVAAKRLLPTPYKPHYTFSMRDLSKIYQVALHQALTEALVCACIGLLLRE